MRQRSRTSDYSENSDSYLDFSLILNGLGTGKYWNPLSAIPGLAFSSPPLSYQYMEDNVEKGVWHFNDCYNAKVVSDFRRRAGHNLFSPSATLGGPILDGYSNVTVGSKAVGAYFAGLNSGIPCRSIIREIKPLLSHTTVPEVDSLGTLYKRYEHYFGDPRLPKSFTIKDDPFNTDFSIWYVLVDLLDFRKLVSSLSRSALPGGRFRPPKGLTAKQLHDAHLGTRFGIIPTVRDLQELVSTIKGWKARYDQYGDVVKKPYYAHSRIDNLQNVCSELSNDDWVEASSFQPTFFTQGAIDYNVRSTTTASWHGQVQYTYSCPEFQGWVNRLSQIVDSFGILDPAALWDVIPFSFVVDWFYSVSSWLHNNRPRLFPAELRILDYLETIAIRTEFSYTVSLAYAIDTSPYYLLTSEEIGREYTLMYLRRRFRPLPGYITLAPRSSIRKDASFVALANRAAIASSLLAQRLPR